MQKPRRSGLEYCVSTAENYSHPNVLEICAWAIRVAMPFQGMATCLICAYDQVDAYVFTRELVRAKIYSALTMCQILLFSVFLLFNHLEHFWSLHRPPLRVCFPKGRLNHYHIYMMLYIICVLQGMKCGCNGEQRWVFHSGMCAHVQHRVMRYRASSGRRGMSCCLFVSTFLWRTQKSSGILPIWIFRLWWHVYQGREPSSFYSLNVLDIWNVDLHFNCCSAMCLSLV